MKLKTFYKDNFYIVSTTNHGWQQANCAFDFGYLGYSDKNFYAPADLTFKRKWGSNYDGGTEYWINGAKNSYIQIVHFTPPNTNNFKLGEKIGLIPGDHVHIALNIEGKWQVYLDYADRSATLYFWRYGQTHLKWTNWNTYTDRQLPLNFIDKSMVIKGSFLCKTNNASWRVRESPNSSSKIINSLSPNTEWTSTALEIYGELINGTTVWIQYGTGWVSGASAVTLDIKQSQDDTCQAALAKAMKDIEAMKLEIASFEPITYYIKRQ